MKYYDGTKLLNSLDINKKKPEIYICTSNRTAGKTTYFNRFVVNRFLKHNEKFCLLYRFKYELDSVSDKFFKDIRNLFFRDYDMTSKKKAKGIFHEMYLNDIHCGYAIAMNSADMIKKYSHFFNDVSHILLDEFQSETNNYCNNEIEKFVSIHTSIARGNGEQYRRVPVYMISNPISIINPYYTALGISNRLKTNTKFLKGDGYVLEQGHNDIASNAQKGGAFNRAFSSNHYVDYSSEGVYLNDNTAFITKVTGKKKYLATVVYKNKSYGFYECADDGFIYVSDKYDNSFPLRIVTTTNDHDINYVMLNKNSFFISNLRYLFERGCFRFKNLECKECCLTTLSY